MRVKQVNLLASEEDVTRIIKTIVAENFAVTHLNNQGRTSFFANKFPEVTITDATHGINNTSY
ncbi:hypothetical protein A0J61_04103 [Choanephora cucurbitarum]|uniref:Uncharacterized protein n=1 Tax=Choanephora cucurbitarum TaxID=101091 RepID=A0A1C7NFJ0_9FUNG|nr:hypothetical protein A0J61_04103 [Choanephora cucurbitarum]